MSNLNLDILTARRTHIKRIVEYQNETEVIMIPLWKSILITIGLCAMCASFAYSVRPNPEVITKIEHVRVSTPVPTCETPFSLKKVKHYQQVVDQLAAAIPETALRNHR